MRAIPKSRILAATETLLLLAIVVACVALWVGRREAAAAVRTDFQLPPPQARPAARPPRAVAAVRKDRSEAAVQRTLRPRYARTFEELYDNPRLNALHLTDEQIDALQECSNQLYLDRLELEARLAQVERVEGEGVFIEIPAYPEAGKALEQAFLSSLAERFGDKMAAAIEAQYLDRIVAENDYLGQRTQQLLVNPDAQNTGLLKVVYTSASPDGVSTGLSTSLVSGGDLRDYGPLAAFFPKP
jgi:hypothetical protein